MRRVKFWGRWENHSVQKRLFTNDSAGFDEFPYEFQYLKDFEENL